MFSLVRCLKTAIVFPPHDMNKLSDEGEIIKRVRDKIEGRCLTQHGYIIQFVQNSGSQQNKSYKISVPSVQENGCKVHVTFSAICFKPEKNDIIDIKIKEVLEDRVTGVLGHAQVMIPKIKMDESCQYKKDENVFIVKGNSDLRIDKGSKVRCKCFEVEISMNFQMKIVAELTKSLIPYISSE